MKYSEFNKKMADFELQYTESDVFIYYDGVTIGKVDRLQRYTMSTYYEGLSQFPDVYVAKAFEAMAMLAETPLADREKQYRLRLVVPPLLRTVQAKPSYVVIRRIDGSPDTSYSPMEYEGFKKIFTESEIAEMDITGFEKEPVE
nr:hypothetical protein [uncultured Trichococcus sp.]